jgi:hypothetical protein
MNPRAARLITVHIVFSIGLLLMLLGCAFLLGSLEGATRLSVLRAFFFVIIGVLCAVFAIKLHKRSLYLFLAAFFLMVGFFLLLSSLRIIPISFTQGWPLLSVFSGLALFPSGWHRFGRLRSHYAVPAIAFVFLGCVLLVFSFEIVPFSFAQFILDWWPLLIVLAGLMLVLLSLGTKKNSEDPKP